MFATNPTGRTFYNGDGSSFAEIRAQLHLEPLVSNTRSDRY